MPILLVGGLLTAFGLIAFGAKSNKEAQEAIGRKTDVVAIATDEIVSEASRDEQTEAKFQKVFDACELDENGIVVLPETIDFDESFRLKNVEFWSGEDLVADDRAIDASATFMDDEFLGVLLKNVDGSLQPRMCSTDAVSRQ